MSSSTGKRGQSSPQIPGQQEPNRSSAGGFVRCQCRHGEETRGGISGILFQRELNIHDQHILPPGHQSQEGTGTPDSSVCHSTVTANHAGATKRRVLSLFPPSFQRDAHVGERPALGFVSLSPPCRGCGWRGRGGRSQGAAGRAVLEPAAGAGTRRAGSSRSGRSRERRGPGSVPGRVPPGGDIAGMVGSVWRRERGAGGAGGEGDRDCRGKEGAGMADVGKSQNPGP